MTATALRRSDVTAADLDALMQCTAVAWDIETTGLEPRVAEIGTCQLDGPDVGTFIVQMDGTVPERLRDLLAAPQVTKVFHHAPFDLRFMSAAWKVQPANVACTKVASKLLEPLAPGEHHTLKALLHRVLDVDISKEQRLSDWRSDRLSPAQLAYAANDVVHLLRLHEELVTKMKRCGLLDLYERCMAFLPTRVELDLGGWPDVFNY